MSRNHRLIMFVGPPGAGKSSLSRSLWEQLTQGGIPAELLLEQDVYALQELQAFTAAWQRCDPGGIEMLLAAARTLAEAWSASHAVWITDTFLPAFHWLLGKYPIERVDAYAETLFPILAPLDPLLVTLDADIGESWRRAVADRGRDWSDWMVQVFRRRDFPTYPGEPIENVDTLLDFFRWGQAAEAGFIARWPGPLLVLPTTEMPLEQAQTLLLSAFGGTQPAGPDSAPPTPNEGRITPA